MKKTIGMMSLVVITVMFFNIKYVKNRMSTLDNENVTWWCQNKYSHVKNMGDSKVYLELMNQTGVNVNFIHVPSGEYRERFLSLMNQEKLPDIITHDFVDDYPGGPEKAMNDGIIVPLNNIIEDYCPNFKLYLSNNPDIRKMISLKDGRIFCFPSLQKEREIRTYMGPFMRKDYLEKLDLSVPSTINEWHEVLTESKKKLGIVPLSFYGGKVLDTDFMIGAYGLSWDMYLDDGVVKLGPLEEDFKSFMKEFKKWYAEGLISNSIFTDSQKTYSAKAKKGKTCIYIDYISAIEIYQNKIDDAEFIPLNYPVLNKGDKPFSGHIVPVFIPYSSAYITKDNKNVESTAKLLDYAYSESGGLLFNFGIFRESYEIIEGQPYYTADIKNYKDGISNGIKKYLAAGPFIRDPRQFKQMLVLESQIKAIEMWSDTNAENCMIPSVAFSADEAEIIADFKRGYEDVLFEWIKNFCLTDDTTVIELQNTLKKMGSDKVLEIYQEALNGY